VRGLFAEALKEKAAIVAAKVVNPAGVPNLKRNNFFV